MKAQKHSLWKKNNTSQTYKLFFSEIKNQNTYSDAGIAIESDFRPCFKQITDIISTASFQLNDQHKAHVIVVYAATHAWSQKEPQIREDFYNKLEKVTSKHAKNKHLLLILGDFSAKGGSGHQANAPITLANMAKGPLNSNGEHLLEYTKENNLILTNTLFYLNFAHWTTWRPLECVSPHLSIDGKYIKIL